MPKVKYTNAKGLFQEAGSGIDISAGLLNSRKKVVQLTDAAGAGGAIRGALSVSESGTTFLVPALTGGTQFIVLPPASAQNVGVTYRFVASGTLARIFQVRTSVANEKIVAAVPDGDGTVTVATNDYITLTATAALGASLEITCISTTVANAWFVSRVTSGIAAATGEHALAGA